MGKTRRDFIKISSVGAGGILAYSGVKFLPKKEDEERETLQYGVKRLPTYCEVCFWKCAGWVYFDTDGKMWKIEGNENDPHCNGRFCPRGSGGIGMYRDEDRLKNPLIRTEKNGKQVYKEVTWNFALDYIARKMTEIAEKDGPESVALFNHGSGGKHFSSLLKAFGSANIAAPSYAQCRGPREVGFETTFGKAVNSPEPTDLKNTKCLVLIGSHIGENMHNSQVQEMSDAIDNGATIITVDPRCSTAASHSKYWLPIKASTDIALLLAWMHVLIYQELYDKEYIEKYAFGFEELKEHVKDKTPEWAESITNIKADDIRKTAMEMAHAAPATIVHPGRHVTWYGDDTQRLRCIAILNALLGSWGRKGGFFFPAKAGLPSFPHPPYPKPKWDWHDTLHGRYSLAGLSVSNALIDASHPDNTSDKKIKAWFVVGTNLISTVPDTKRTLEAINNLDLMVVVDTMPMEITGYADVILPECTYLERCDDLRSSPSRIPNVAVRMKTTEPKYLSKPSSWIVQRLGKRLGLGAYFKYKNYEEVIDWQLKYIGSSLSELRKIGVKTFPRDEKELFINEDEQMTFDTNTGMIELYSTAMEDEGFDPLPNYTPHPDPPEGFFRLNYGRAPMHTFARTNNNPFLADVMDENTAWINPAIAKQYGIKQGQKIWLKNQDGIMSEFPIKVRLTERIGFDSIYMVHGFGHSNKLLSRSHGKGISDTQLMTNVKVDPVMGGTGMRLNFVTFVLDNESREEVVS